MNVTRRKINGKGLYKMSRVMIMFSQTKTNGLLIWTCTASGRAFHRMCIFFANAHPIRNICETALFHVFVAIEKQIEVVLSVWYQFKRCVLNPGSQWKI